MPPLVLRLVHGPTKCGRSPLRPHPVAAAVERQHVDDRPAAVQEHEPVATDRILPQVVAPAPPDRRTGAHVRRRHAQPDGSLGGRIRTARSAYAQRDARAEVRLGVPRRCVCAGQLDEPACGAGARRVLVPDAASPAPEHSCRCLRGTERPVGDAARLVAGHDRTPLRCRALRPLAACLRAWRVGHVDLLFRTANGNRSRQSAELRLRMTAYFVSYPGAVAGAPRYPGFLDQFHWIMDRCWHP